nr:serine/threonine-protein kinase D6PKL2-like [Tanacetum cinerariifolium]
MDHRGRHRRRHYRRLPKHQLQLHHHHHRLSPHFLAMEPPWTTEEITAEDITKDFQSISFNSTTNTAAIDINRNTNSITSETTWTTATYSSSSKPTLNPSPTLSLHDIRFIQRLGAGDMGFYASEVVVAIEYLHMLDIVYRDLKPENVLVRSDGHIMLTDFDLSLKCDVTASTPTQVFLGPNNPTSTLHYTFDPPKVTSSPRRQKKKLGNQTVPQFIAEPVDVRSMSFVGTHEYLAPEIVSGEGHGSAVDWWTLGIFMFELFYDVTPFRGMDNKLTLVNIIARALEFPKEPTISPMAKDLISQLLAKDPARRLGSTMGASAIKHHLFFQEFCPGGDLHVLRQRQPYKRFLESAVRRRQKKKPGNQTGPQFVAEPVDVRSMSFVGTHEYLPPEIVSGKGHGSAVDWWTLGIFMFELFYGVTPFRGMDNKLTLANIIARALEFPKEPAIPPMAKDLISQLLAGASAIKHHSFFQGVNWDLLRYAKSPFVPPPFNISSREVVSDDSCRDTPVDCY